MTSHPIATPEQHAVEREAVALTRHPIVKEAYERVRTSWLEAANPSPAMRGCFAAAFEEVMFSAAVWSLNQVRCARRSSASRGSRMRSAISRSRARAGESTIRIRSTG